MKNLNIAIPSIRGISENTDNLIQSIKSALRDSGISSDVSIIPGCCYIQVARNILVKNYYEGTADKLLFLDDDVYADPNAIVDMIKMDLDVVSIVYRRKNKNVDYPLVFKLPKKPIKDTKVFPCSGTSLGCTVIDRSVIEKMYAMYIQNACTYSGIDIIDIFPQGNYNGNWVGEDYAFCFLYDKIGGDIQVYADADTVHYDYINNIEYSGNYYKHLNGGEV